MTRQPLVACSLDAAGQKQRFADWASLLRDAARREETSDGVRYRFVAADRIESRLRTLSAAEKKCCAFLNINIIRTVDEIEMTVTAPPDAVGALRFIFSGD